MSFARNVFASSAKRTLATLRTMSTESVLPPPQLPPSLKDLTTPAKLHLYTASTPNGYKASVLLEELLLAYPEKVKDEISYDFRALSFAKLDQKTPEFLKINPNGRIPALVDDNVKDPQTGESHNVFESASIILWLIERYDTEHKFSFEDPILRSKALSWIFWAHGGVGPMQGQANHFFRYAPEKIPYGIKRYQDETTRLYGVLEDGLNAGKGEWLVGDKYSIADINLFGWVRGGNWAGIDITPFPKIQAWIKRIEARPGAQAGIAIPEARKTNLTQAEQDEQAKKARDWIFKGNETGK